MTTTKALNGNWCSNNDAVEISGTLTCYNKTSQSLLTKVKQNNSLSLHRSGLHAYITIKTRQDINSGERKADTLTSSTISISEKSRHNVQQNNNESQRTADKMSSRVTNISENS